MNEDVSFPRGGVKPPKTKTFIEHENIFSPPSKNEVSQKSQLKKRNKEATASVPSTNLQTKNHELILSVADTLQYKTLQENMLVLGCICSITSLSMQIALPGRTFAKVMVQSISAPFTHLLKLELKHNNTSEEKNIWRLKSMFNIGQLVPTKVLRITHDDNSTKVFVTINPNDINKDLDHTIFQNGMLLWAAVASELDHGYQLDVGIQNCRTFLPKNCVENSKSFVVGQPLWCIIQRCEISSAASIITVSTLQKDIDKAIQTRNIDLHYLIPGMQFNFTITKKIQNGYRGEYMNGCIGYINEYHLNLNEMANYQVGSTVKAKLLYTEPITKFSCFSLTCFDIPSSPLFPVGEVTQAQVLRKTTGGLLLKLPKAQKGYISYKRLSRTLSQKDNINIINAITKKYPKGCKHQCRIIGYHHMDHIYICTFEQSIIKEKIYSENDVKIGDLVKVKVKAINQAGLMVKLGNLNGFIQNFHLSCLQFSENLKKRFSVGQTLHARVWNIDDRGIDLTLKSTLVESDLCLRDINDVIDNKQYPGVVGDISKNGLLVLFYGGLRGFVSAKTLKQTSEELPREIFYDGQVIMVTVRKKDNRLILSLDPPKPSKRLGIRIGQYVDAIITKIDEHLVVEAGPNKVTAIILPQHLSSSISLSALLLKTYNVGDILKGLLCVSDRDTPLLSIRETVMHERQNLKICKIEDLKVGSLVRGFYQSRNPKGIYVSVPFKPIKRTLMIFNAQLTDNADYSSLYFQPEQPLVLKVIRVNIENKNLRVTAKLSEVFDNNCEYALSFLEQYLNDVKQIKACLLKENSPLANLQLGERVNCVVNKVDKNGCSVFMDNNIQGLVHKEHMPGNVKPGQKIQGVVLWIDYQDMFVELSLNKDVINKINRTQDGNVEKFENYTTHADILLVRTDFAIAVIRSEKGNKQLIFLPTHLHENSFENIQYTSLEKIKVVICRKTNNMLIGMNKVHKTVLKKRKQNAVENSLPENRKRKHKDMNIKGTKKPRLEIITNQSDTESEEEDDLEVKEEAENTTDHDSEMQSEPENDDTDNNDDSFNNEDFEMNSENEEECNNGNDSNDVDSEIEPEEDDENEINLSNEDVEEDSDLNESEDDAGSSEVQSGEDDEKEVPARKISKKSHKDEQYVESEESSEYDEDEFQANSTVETNVTNKTASLPGIQNFFTNGESKHASDSNLSSEDEDAEKQVKITKKKRLTPAERSELARQQEEEIRKKEMEIANLSDPQSPEQFDRLLLGQPNSSELWAKYVAYYISNMQIDNARAVARKGLKTIDFSETKERFNLWVALLHLEYNYGEKNKFNKIFEEAVRCNDALEIYLVVIEMLAEIQQFSEMDEKIRKARSKFKQESKMWTSIGRIYYQNKRFTEARNFKDCAIRILENKSEHVNIIVQFAIMEFKYGERHQAEALFETMLTSLPKRIDLWSIYVDQIIKLQDYESARRILQRAVSQRIPPKKLKPLFQKFKQFEMNYGTEETVQQVIELAKKCIASQGL